MPPILVVGTVAYDSVKTPFGKAEEVLGGSATYFSLSAGLFTEVCLVACVGEDFREQDRRLLRQRGIDLDGLQALKGKTFRWTGEYGYDLNEAHTLDTQLNVLADFNPELPPRHRELEYVFLGNFDPTLQRQVLSQVRAPRLVACDTMNYWINGHLQALLTTLKQVQVLIVNDAEVRLLTQEPNLSRAARRILSWGPKTLVVKRGEYGALMFQIHEGNLSVFGVPAYPLETVLDPTGAGDSFAGGFMGFLAGIGRVDSASLRQAVIFGSVMASFCVEKFSMERLKELTFTEIELRYREFRRMTHFDEPGEWRDEKG
jgi:sugar/nucleoside kinase (ribokinase family)